jgi:hypothetical protein
MNYSKLRFYTRKTTLFSAYFFSAITALCILLSSCTEVDSLGFNLLPKSDQSLFDSLGYRLDAFSYKEDSLKSDNVSLNLMGSYQDPVFGQSIAGTMLQFILGENNPNFGDNPIIDSVIYSMPYAGYYGEVSKITGKQTFNIYQLNNRIYKANAYYSNLNPKDYYSDGDLIGSKTFQPNVRSTTVLTDTTVEKFILDTSFGQFILNQQNNITTSDALQEVFKGIYIVPEYRIQASGTGAILYYNLLSTNNRSKISLYYHNNSGTGKVFELFITGDCARINTFKHEYNGISGISTQLKDTTKGTESIYIQNMAGLSAKIWLKQLQQLKDSMPIAITKAELIMPVDLTSTTGKYEVPSKILLVEKSESGVYQTNSDFDLGGSYANGYYNNVTNDYRFNIARYAQDIVSGKRTEKGLYLIPASAAIGANRVVLKGSKYMRLKLTYTKTGN